MEKVSELWGRYHHIHTDLGCGPGLLSSLLCVALGLFLGPSELLFSLPIRERKGLSGPSLIYDSLSRNKNQLRISSLWP